jgi:hypothetical protein
MFQHKILKLCKRLNPFLKQEHTPAEIERFKMKQLGD